MKSVRARLGIEVLVDCPNCDSLINLLDEKDTNGVNVNEDGLVMKQACPNGNWFELHKKFKVKNVTCSRCKKQLDVKGFDW